MQLRWLKLVLGGPAVLAAAFFAAAEPALCVIDLQLFGGERTAEFKYTTANGAATKTFHTTEMGAAVHVTPAFFVPLSIGLIGTKYSYNIDSISQAIINSDLGSNSQYYSSTGTGSNTGLLYGPDLFAWLPIGFFQPYVRLAYLMGTEKQTLNNSAATLADVTPTISATGSETDSYSIKETAVSIGIRLQPIRFIGVFAEYSMERGTRTHTSTSSSATIVDSGQSTTQSVTTIPSTEKTAQTASTNVVRIGIQTGF